MSDYPLIFGSTHFTPMTLLGRLYHSWHLQVHSEIQVLPESLYRLYDSTYIISQGAPARSGVEAVCILSNIMSILRGWRLER
jgi:hypothetical protein